jgi:hypothetical protein
MTPSSTNADMDEKVVEHITGVYQGRAEQEHTHSKCTSRTSLNWDTWLVYELFDILYKSDLAGYFMMARGLEAFVQPSPTTRLLTLER